MITLHLLRLLKMPTWFFQGKCAGGIALPLIFIIDIDT